MKHRITVSSLTANEIKMNVGPAEILLTPYDARRMVDLLEHFDKQTLFKWKHLLSTIPSESD